VAVPHTPSLRPIAIGAARALALVVGASIARADSPFAAAIVSYTPGTGAAAGFSNAASALGAPERFTGEGLVPSCVTPFQPPFMPGEIVSIGVGGELVVAFDHDVLDDPRNPFGIDLLVFGNAFFTDQGFGEGIVAGLASEGGEIAVSADGIDWRIVAKVEADGLFPTLGYRDASPYATSPGSVETDFLRPVDPSWTMADLVGLPYESLLDAYDGSGGGVGVDIGATGLPAIRFVRVSGPGSIGFSPEIDAFADVAAAPSSADLDDDGDVGAGDLAILLGAWGSADARADLDANGVVEAGDLAILLAAWGSDAP
jgi:hypothetical protein